VIIRFTDLNDYILIVVLATMIYAGYQMFAASRQGKRNISRVMTEADEIAARAHEDAERTIALLTETC